MGTSRSAEPRQRKLGFGTWVLVLLSAVGGLSQTSSSLGFPQQPRAQAKNDYALIYGTVLGPDDRRVPGVPIRIRPASEKKAKWELISDNSGEFAQRVPVGAGDYVIEAEVRVPKGQQKPEIKVHIDDNERKDVSLHLTQPQLSKR